MNDLEAIWSALLSEDAAAIRRAWSDLTDDEAQAVVTHLKRMTTGEGYSADQRRAAQFALEAIREAG